MNMGKWIFLVVVGVLSIIGGFLAILNPFPASLVAVKLAGWFFLIIGAMEIFDAFRATGWAGRLWSLMLGAIALVAGINLLSEPLTGMVSLTMVMAVLFIVSGIAKLVAGLQIKQSQYRLVMMASGAISLLLGIMIFSNFPASAFTILGVLLGIELISNGISALSLGWSRKGGAAAAA
jgi:membrane protein HdeD